MDKLHLKPYTFRSRMMWALYVSSAFAAVISLLFAYVISHMNVQSELKLQEQAIALYLLEMEQRTELPLNVIMTMVETDTLDVEILEHASSELDQEMLSTLAERTLFTDIAEFADTPVTYVQLRSNIVRIDAVEDQSLFAIAFLRIIFTALSYLAVFVLMITFATFRLSRPVQSLTAATSRIQEGDFDVRLPSDAPGEMGELMRSFNDMARELGQTAYLQKDFISSISHEFKTPIASIRGFAKLLQMPGITEEQRAEYISLIAQESDRLSRLSETLLRLTALEQQTAPASLGHFPLDEQLRQVILRLEPNWSAKNIDLDLDLKEVSLVSDEALLSHVWINLIQNAIKFSDEDGLIEVRVFQTDRAIVEIADHGCGMDEAAQQRIFDRFYQADKSRRQEGIGLGLCLVKRILDMLGGEITVHSAPGEGSTFRVILPLKPPRHHSEEKLNA